MKRLIALLPLLSLSLFSFKTTASTTFVGNAGDGFLINGKVYLSDLVLGGDDLYLNPWYGTYKSPEPIVEPELAESLGVSSELLDRKLWDLNAIRLGLGHMVGDSIRLHRWIFTDLILGATCDQAEPIIDLDASDIHHVQIANRHEGEIRLQRRHWLAMDEEQRVALLVHEGLYSLLKPSTRSWGTCPSYQQANLTRKMVRLAYLPPGSEKRSFTKQMLQALPLTRRIEGCFRFDTSDRRMSSIRIIRGKDAGELIRGREYNPLPANQSYWAQSEFKSLQDSTVTWEAEALCSLAARHMKEGDPVTLILSRKPYWMTPTDFGFGVIERVSQRRVDFNWAGQQMCTENIRRFKTWFQDSLIQNPDVRPPVPEKCTL